METYRKSEKPRFLSKIFAITLMVVLLISIESSADTLMPLPAFDHTYSSSGNTRGYWFEAPTNFEIVGLRVPGESGHGIQNVEIVRFNNQTPPPSHSSTTNNFVSLGRFVNQPSGNILPVSIPILAGDVIGILGAAGTSTMYNSYGQGDFISEIDGHPVTLTRMGMQYNLFSNTANNLWQEPGYYIGRVEMWYSTECEPPDAPMNPDPSDGAGEVPVDTELAWNVVIPVPCDLANGGFESGGFAPWTTVTGPGSQLTPWNVTSGGTGWFGNDFPAEGSFFAQNGFDGDGGLFYDIYQEITIPANASSAILNWRERIQWSIVGSLPREYVVTLQPAGGGSPLAVLYSMNLNPGTSGDTGYVSHSIDLLDAAPGTAGQTVRISFHEAIPEFYTGPAQFDLDGISLVCDGSVVQLSPPSPPVNTIDFSALSAQYDLLRQESLARQNVPAGVRMGDESNTVKDDSTPVAGTLIEVLNIGGPDCGGYTFIDSDEPGGPSFDWIEISGSGTNLNLTDDSWYYPINLPFSFDFYGAIHNQVAVGSNGTVHFVDRYMTLGNQCMPASVSGINEFIALYWDDLYPSGSENVYYKVVGSAPNRILVVQWENVRHYGSSSSGVTAQAQLFENAGDILLLYADPSSEAGAGGTVGIQRDSGCGLQYSCNQQNLRSGLAVLFTRGDVPCNSSTTYDVYFGTDPNSMELICDDICETTCDPTPEDGSLLDQPCVTYYWQVIVENQCGITEGDIWSFTTEGVCNQDPNCSGAFPSVSLIWPPNHKLADIEIDGVTDPDGDPVSITITGITQDEPVQENGSGSGQTSPDGVGIGTSLACVRSERSGNGNGRVYQISFDATDGNGGICSGAVEVCVAHNACRSDGGGPLCIDDGQLYDSTASGMLRASEMLRRADLNGDGIINQIDFNILTNHWLESYELED
jgi:hypothetical protein